MADVLQHPRYGLEPWEHTLNWELISDPHISGRYGFTIYDPDDSDVFESGLVYSSRESAVQAAEDCCHAAWKWRAMKA